MTGKEISIICGICAAVLLVIFIFFYFLHRKYARKWFAEKVYKKLYSLAQDQDYYLLNNVLVKTEMDKLHINHLLVGEKFVYVIASRYYEDNLHGDSYQAQHWNVVDRNSKSIKEITNPVQYNERRALTLARFLGWNSTKSTMFISLVVINNGCKLKVDNPVIGDDSYIVHKKDLKKLVKRIEKNSKLPSFDEDSLNRIVARIHRLSVDETHQEEQEKEEEDFNEKKKD